MRTPDDVMEDLFLAAKTIPDIRKDEAVFDAIKRSAPDHPARALAATRVLCTDCGFLSTIEDTLLNLTLACVACPRCVVDGTLIIVREDA